MPVWRIRRWIDVRDCADLLVHFAQDHGAINAYAFNSTLVVVRCAQPSFGFFYGFFALFLRIHVVQSIKRYAAVSGTGMNSNPLKLITLEYLFVQSPVRNLSHPGEIVNVSPADTLLGQGVVK